MGIFSRLSDIINSNISAILDKAENPEKMIRMMIQEMEETLVEVRSSTAKVIAEKKTVNRRIDRLRQQAADWESKAELALGKEREDLARAALIEKNSVLETVKALEEELGKLDMTLDKLSVEIEQLQAKLTDARARQKTLLMRTTAAQSRVDVNQKLHDVNIDSAMHKFEYYERKIDLMEGQVDSMNLKQRGLADEFEELANQEKIDQELETIKAKLNKKPAE
jgi:phage shock protein A